MQFSATDITAMLAAMGETVTTDFASFTGVFSKAGKLVQAFNGTIVSTGPLLTISETDAAGITENETVITIGGDMYMPLSKLTDGTGFVEIELTRDY